MAMASQTPEKKITLMSSDGQLFDVEEGVVMEIGNTVKAYFEDNSCQDDAENTNTTVPLHNVSSVELAKIITYGKKRVELRNNSSDSEAEMKRFVEGFLKDEDEHSLIELILAVNYLDVKELFELLAQRIADKIANKSVEYVRAIFNIENDYTPEEEQEARNENSWAFEGVDED